LVKLGIAILIAVALLLVIGLASSSRRRESGAPSAKVTQVDPRSILFSLPTICDTLPPLVPTAAPQGVPTLHEDDWRQVEFVGANDRPAVASEIQALQRFKTDNRASIGWKACFVRRERPNGIADSHLSFAELLRAVKSPASPLAVSSVEGVHPVEGGFAISLDSESFLYGFHHDDLVLVLGLQPDGHPISDNTVSTLRAISARFQLILVDWPSTSMVIDVDPAAVTDHP